MGATCCRRNEELQEPEVDPMELPEPDKSLKKISTKQPQNNNKSFNYTRKVIQIQSWFRGIQSRKIYRGPPFTCLTIINYIADSVTSPVEAVRERENELGVFVVHWDLTKNMDLLELRKSVIDKSNCQYHGYWNKVTGEKEGYGQQLFPNGTKYEGFWKNSQFEDQGRYIYDTGDYYQGNWKQGRTEGIGIFYSSEGIKYIGEWKNNMHHGKGQETWEDGSIFEGNYIDGRKEGKGRFVWNDGSSYEGEFFNNMINGFGIYVWADGRRYKGLWKSNHMEGKGEFFYSDKKIYSGEMHNDLRNGQGTLIWPNGQYYEGEFIGNNGLQQIYS